jgi:STE24 endopeptidase
VVVRTRTTSIAGPTRARLAALADEVGVSVHDFRALRGRSQKVANAAQFGVFPGLRYVIVTDYLLDQLSPDELDAVVAHELAHARQHHVLLKIGAGLGVWAGLEALAFGLAQAVGSRSAAAWIALPLLIAVPLALVTVQGLFGVRLEKQADDIAAETVGPRELAGALRHIGDLNHTQHHNSSAWSVVTQHPGLDERIGRLSDWPRGDAAGEGRHAARSEEHSADQDQSIG